ncbi:hypothetical protein FACS1894111_06940 [Clostridia bacterium]|nr:hypothetical protein FACS1894111_06940 [Clostridia bacterium]
MMDKYLQKWKYILEMRPVLLKNALYSDGTADYLEPDQPKAGDLVSIRFRTAKDNVDNVWLCCRSEYSHGLSQGAGKQAQLPELEMEKYETSDGFDYYFAVILIEESSCSYHFKIRNGIADYYYDRMGVTREIREEYAFRIVPGFSTPDWAKGAVMYQILVDRFYNGDRSNDVLTGEYAYIHGHSKATADWQKMPDTMNVGEFYGGDLKGVSDKLDYLKDLGVEVIYFNPLFVSPSNHKYDIQDYDNIDPHYGAIVEDEGELLPEGVYDNTKASRYIKRVTSQANLKASNEIFIRLVEQAHKRGMRVILDGVFNHCGSFNKWLDKERIYQAGGGYAPGAYTEKESPYSNFFKFYDENAWPNNPTYDGWWGHDTLPKLNYEGSRALLEYVLSIGKKWVSPPFSADGWRLDVAADLGHGKHFNHYFWQAFRHAVKEANPGAIILAEHYGDPSDWLMGDQWDTVMNYDAFMEPITYFLTGMEKHSDDYREDLLGNYAAFEGAMRYNMTKFLTPSLYCAMNELSNHDHSRFLTRTNHKVGRVGDLGYEAASEGVDKAILKEAVVFQMTWPGAPTLYYGDEAGVCGFTDPDNRRTYPWGGEDKELLHFHKAMIRIHKEHRVLRTGSVLFLAGEAHLLCYARFSRKEQIIVMINNDRVPREKNLSVWEAGIPKECELVQLLFVDRDSFSLTSVVHDVTDGKLAVILPAHSALVLKRKHGRR